VTLSTCKWLRLRSMEQWRRLRTRGMQPVPSLRRDSNGNEKPAEHEECHTTVEEGGIPTTGRNRASAPFEKC
ncbi:hypothetical protein AAVH_25931, partial [Aphelenchoides avenae]